MRSVTIRIDGRPPTPNARRHWRVTALDNETWKGAARISALAALPAVWEPLRRCTVDVTFVFATKARHDWDNAIAAQKPVLDGIVSAGVIADDSTDVIARLQFWCEHRKGESATVYRIEEAA